VPILRVARLAVDQPAAGRGLGRALLRFLIELAERMRVELGCVGLVVDASRRIQSDSDRRAIGVSGKGTARLDGVGHARPVG
jgi:GNAT superfamily N-acetyltransferase